MGFGDGSGISWTICKQSAPRSSTLSLKRKKIKLRNDLYCVEWGVKLYSNQPTLSDDYVMIPPMPKLMYVNQVCWNYSCKCKAVQFLEHTRDHRRPVSLGRQGRDL